MFDLIEQIEELIEPYQAIKFELSDIDNLTQDLDEYHAAFFTLQSSLVKMQQSPAELQSAVTPLKKVFTDNLLSKIKHWHIFYLRKVPMLVT